MHIGSTGLEGHRVGDGLGKITKLGTWKRWKRRTDVHSGDPEAQNRCSLKICLLYLGPQGRTRVKRGTELEAHSLFLHKSQVLPGWWVKLKAFPGNHGHRSWQKILEAGASDFIKVTSFQCGTGWETWIPYKILVARISSGEDHEARAFVCCISSFFYVNKYWTTSLCLCHFCPPPVPF